MPSTTKTKKKLLKKPVKKLSKKPTLTKQARQIIKTAKLLVKKLQQRIAGKMPNDVEVRLANKWCTVSSVEITIHSGWLHWRSPGLSGWCNESYWRWKT